MRGDLDSPIQVGSDTMTAFVLYCIFILPLGLHTQQIIYYNTIKQWYGKNEEITK
jgi:hypothetical protein